MVCIEKRADSSCCIVPQDEQSTSMARPGLTRPTGRVQYAPLPVLLLSLSHKSAMIQTGVCMERPTGTRGKIPIQAS